IPLLVGHILAVGPHPADILYVRALDAAPLEELATAQYRVVFPQADQATGEVEQGCVLFAPVPLIPAYLVILAVGVVVAELGAAALVAAEDHRYALAEQEGRQEIALLLLPQ